MITPNMTNSELVAEFKKQTEKLEKKVKEELSLNVVNEIKSDLKKIKPAFRRNYFKIKIRSLYFDFNEWHVLFYCGKKGFRVRYLCRIEDKVKKMSKYLYADDVFNIKIYSGHFFSRYKSRFLNQFGFKLKRSEILAHFFMIDNVAGNNYFINKTLSKEVTSECFEIYNSGIGLCRKDIENELIEVNTFLTYQELKRSQLESLLENLIYHYEIRQDLNNYTGNKNRVDIYLRRELEKNYKISRTQVMICLDKYNINRDNFVKKITKNLVNRYEDDLKNLDKFFKSIESELS